jgi:hypothetical protein
MAKVMALDRRQRSRTALKNQVRPALDGTYSDFNQLDGKHPWQTAVPEGCLLYDVRILPGGKVAYFNWDLAKEMGLIPDHHPHRLNRGLEDKLLETFCIRIVNEWDHEHNVIYPKTMMKKNKYMATRYLQLQHPDKAGRTSGDGRCVWNGIVKHRGQIWDVSSRGTGVTALAPGVVLAGKPLRSGNSDHGYGCGMAEIDELYAAAIMAEVFHRNGIPTERVLAIIDLGKGMGIGVRAGHNLLRPAHLFVHLRQGEHDRLKKATDYFIDRQHGNREWSFSAQHRRRYDLMLNELTTNFARFAAHLDREYIFAWLDWDGDNVLGHAGIIDYGSVRQFGLRHDQYRYDDVERFSTNLNEQRAKARLIVQTFAQMTDFVQTGVKKPIDRFRKHASLKRFDELFQFHLLDRLLYQIGFTDQQRELLLSKHASTVKKFFAKFSYFERMKTYRKLTRVADGVNRPAIFNMRAVLAHLPEYFLANLNTFSADVMPAQQLFEVMLSDHAAGKDKQLTDRLTKRLQRLQLRYKELVKRASGKAPVGEVLVNLSERASRINRTSRITGNSLIHVVDELLKARRKGFSDTAIQEVMNAIIDDQTLASEMRHTPGKASPSAATTQLLSQVLTLVLSHAQEI